MNINPVLKLNPKDDVVIARQAVPAGTRLEEEHITVLSDIPAGHKIALHALKVGDAVRRYGQLLASQLSPLSLANTSTCIIWEWVTLNATMPGVKIAIHPLQPLNRIPLWVSAAPMAVQLHVITSVF